MILGTAPQPQLLQTPPTGAADPLRLLTSGTTTTVQVAMNPEDGTYGIVYQGVYYPASLPDTVKLGELLKVLLQTEADLLFLKILSENEPNEKTKTQVLNPEEKKVLREALQSGSKSQPQEASKETLKLEVHTTPQNLPGALKVIKEDSIQTPQSTPTPQTAATLKNESVISQQKPGQSPRINGSELSKITPEPLISTPLSATFNNSVEEWVVSFIDTLSASQEVARNDLPQMISLLSKNISMTAPVIKDIQELNDEEIFVVLKLALKKLAEKDPGLPKSPFGASAEESDFSRDPQVISKKQNSKISEQNLILPLKAESLKNILVQKPTILSEITIQTPKHIQALLQSTADAFLKTTEVIEKIHTQTPYLPQGVYIAIPFAQPQGNSAVEFFLPRDHDPRQKKEKRRKTSRTQMRLSLPLLGELLVEFLTINDEFHIRIIVEDELTRDRIAMHRSILENTFFELGVKVPSFFVEKGRVSSIKPEWVKEQLGIQTRA